MSARAKPPNATQRLDAAHRERAVRVLRRRDSVLARVIRGVGPCGIRPAGDPYRSLVRSVLYQQLAGSAARAIHGRLRARYGGREPAPDVLRRARPRDLRALGLSRQKIAALKSIAEAFDSGRVSARRLHRMSDDDVIEAVTQIHGVGEWTAHMLLMFSLGRADVLPVGDYGIRKGAMTLYDLGELPDRAGLETLAAPWRPYRSVASWYLWRYADVAPPE